MKKIKEKFSYEEFNKAKKDLKKDLKKEFSKLLTKQNQFKQYLRRWWLGYCTKCGNDLIDVGYGGYKQRCLKCGYQNY